MASIQMSMSYVTKSAHFIPVGTTKTCAVTNSKKNPLQVLCENKIVLFLHFQVMNEQFDVMTAVKRAICIVNAIFRSPFSWVLGWL